MIIEGDGWRLSPGAARAMGARYKSFLDYIKDPELKKRSRLTTILAARAFRNRTRTITRRCQSPTTHIVKGHIAHIVPDGVVIADGTHVKLDVLDLGHRFRCARLYAADERHGLNSTTIHRGVEGKDLFYGARAAWLSPPVHALRAVAPGNNVPVPLGLDQESPASCGYITEARAGRADRQPRRTNSSPASARLPGTVWIAAAITGTPASSPRRSFGPFRRGAQSVFEQVPRRISVHSHRRKS